MNFLFGRSALVVMVAFLLFATARVNFSQSLTDLPVDNSSSKPAAVETKKSPDSASPSKTKVEKEAAIVQVDDDSDAAEVGPSTAPFATDKYDRYEASDTTNGILTTPPRSSDNSGWQVAMAPYLFASGISGKVGARGREIEMQSNFGNVWHNLDIGLMGAFEVSKGRFVNFNDMIWTKLSAERDTPGPFYSTAKLGVNLFILDPEVGYRMITSKRGFLDTLGGVRIWSVETNLNVTTGVRPGFDVSQRKTWGAPVVGLRGNYNVTRKFFLAGKFDIGGAGIGADLTTQLYGAAGFKLTKKFALIGGYRWLQVRYDDSKGFLFDTRMSGLMLGGRITF